MTVPSILVFVVGSILEIFSLTWLSSQISMVNVVSLIMFTLLVGVILGRTYGEEYFDKMKWQLKSREMPAEEVINGAVVRFGSYLLLTPGAITDLLGLIIIIPQTRFIAKNLAVKLFKKKLAAGEQWFFFKGM